MDPFTNPKNFKFKWPFPLFANVATIIKSVNVEMVAETLIFDIIDLSKEPLTPAQSLKVQ